MTRLVSLLDGDPEKAVQSIESNGLLYASAFKSLKSNFGNPLLVETLALREYHQQLKINNTWVTKHHYYQVTT